MGKFVLILFALTLIHASTALKCHYCKDAECTQYTTEMCAIPQQLLQAACLTHITRDKTTKKEYTNLKCAYWERSKENYECDDIPNREQVKCVTCKQDECNSATSIASFGVVTIMATVVALALPRFI